MDQAEAAKQIQNMTTFFKHEALEKANEIAASAAEEQTIQRANLVKAELEKLEKEYEKRKKAIETERKIAYSNAVNQSRLTTLRVRQESVQNVYNDARVRLSQMGQGPEYKPLLQKLITQGLLKMMEKEVLVHCRECDVALTESVLPAAVETFEKLAGFKCKATVAKGRYLPPKPEDVKEGAASCCGGVVVSAHLGRIMCSNTLDSRLEQVFEKMQPQVRTKLFGPSKTRTHFD